MRDASRTERIFARFLRQNFVIDDHRRLSARNKEGRRFLGESVSLESRGTIFRRREERLFHFTTPLHLRELSLRLVKVNIYEDANHRHRSSRLVNQLRRRGFVFTSEGQPSSLLSALRKHVHRCIQSSQRSSSPGHHRLISIRSV